MTAANEQRRRATLSGLARILASGAERGETIHALAPLVRMLTDEFAGLVDDVVGPDLQTETQEAPEAPKPAPILSPAPATPPPVVKPPRKPRAPRPKRVPPVAPIMPPPAAVPAAYAVLGG